MVKRMNKHPLGVEYHEHAPNGQRQQQHNYYDEDIRFAYNGSPIRLFQAEDGEYIKYEDFIKRVQGYSPKIFGIFDHLLIGNLALINVTEMRPVQIATTMVTSFSPPPLENGERSSVRPDFVCISSTGSGKTVAYLVAAIQKCIDVIGKLPPETKRTPTALIFANSVPLVAEVFRTAKALTDATGVKVKLIAGSTKFIRNTFFDIGICTMGRFQNHYLNDSKNRKYVKIDVQHLHLLIVDEADEILKTEEFDQIYTKLSSEATFAKLLFSATVAGNVFSIVNENNIYEFSGGLVNQVAVAVKTYFWEICTKSTSRITGAAQGKAVVGAYESNEIRHPFDALFHFIQRKLFKKRFNEKKAIVFVKRCVVADFIAQRLCCYGMSAVSVHGKQDPRDRDQLFKKFNSGRCRILLATNLLTRGIDTDVDYVVNYDLPTDYVQWIHRCGRTGRNGKHGVAITFIDQKNAEDYPINVLQEIVVKIEGKVPEFMEQLFKAATNEKDEMEQHLIKIYQEYGME